MTMNSLRGIWVLSFYGLSTVVSSLLSLLVSIWSEEEARALAQLWARANLWVAGIRIKVEGTENLPLGSSAGDDECGFIIAANHTSAADIFAILAGLRLDICWVARASLLRKPFMGWHLKRLHIPLARKSVGSAKRFIHEGTCKLDSGAAVVVFPEGTWKEDPGPMLPFKKGSFLLARNTKRPIVPVAIIGSQDLLPPETLIPKKGTITLRIGVPIDPNEFSDLDRISEETYRAISKLLGETSEKGEKSEKGIKR
jgi:1-acyl-sn-glycerol-3-phosphate acyltransferase